MQTPAEFCYGSTPLGHQTRRLLPDHGGWRVVLPRLVARSGASATGSRSKRWRAATDPSLPSSMWAAWALESSSG